MMLFEFDFNDSENNRVRKLYEDRNNFAFAEFEQRWRFNKYESIAVLHDQKTIITWTMNASHWVRVCLNEVEDSVMMWSK